jgi:transcriptional regulator with XRE-family HTH domain
MKQTFGQILKQARQAKGLSQRELAAQAGVDFTYISKLENDRLSPPAIETIGKLSEILEAPEEVLMSAAGKLNDDVREVLAGSPEAVKFLNQLKDMNLTSAEWDRLSMNLKNLR